MPPKTPSKKPRTPRKKKPEAGSKGLAPSDCLGEAPAAIAELGRRIAAAGGTAVASYRDPLGGEWMTLAVLPLAKVQPTPFQRDLSETHAKRLAETITKLGRYLDPIIAVPASDGFWTPNGRHRLEAMGRAGAKSITALVLPETSLQYKILALNVEKAHNLRERSLEVIRMYRGMPPSDKETDHVFEFEEPAFATLGLCYERNGRFGGGAYQPILRRVDAFLDETLAKALKAREARAAKIEKLDGVVAQRVKELQERGMKSPYLKAFVLARCNPLRFMETMPPFDEALDDILRRAEKFSPEKVKAEDVAATAGPPPEGGE